MVIPEYVREQARYELARRSFWEYCKLKAPDFYKESRTYLKEFCNQLQDFLDSPKKVLVVNMPPRHGKSRTLTLFVQWCLGKNTHYKIMTGSYNEILSGTFAKAVRDAIQEEDGIFGKVFPSVKVKYGEASMKKWALEGNEEANYLATSPKGTATGFGCNLMIIDDLIKTDKEAYNEILLEEHQNWFTNTMLSRTETGFKIIVVMTRWATNDLAGFILDKYDGNVIHINYKAIQEDGSMLCEEILNREDFEFKTQEMNKDIVEANYNQVCIDEKGKLYKNLKTYDVSPGFGTIYAYVDTADTGDDFLCCAVYGLLNKEPYILDVLFTDEGMEITEEECADILYRNNVNLAYIESNNGGRGFARNVKRILKEKYKSNKCVIKPFTQTANKQSRILSSSYWVMEHIHFPFNWNKRWVEFYKHITRYQKKGKNAHDDGADVLAGIYDKTVGERGSSFGSTKPA